MREGSYPPPPYWPERLTDNLGSDLAAFFLRFDLAETNFALHTYIADGWPGPCYTMWKDDEFVSWFPALTIDRAERQALAAVQP